MDRNAEFGQGANRPVYHGDGVAGGEDTHWSKHSLVERESTPEVESEPGRRWGKDVALVPISSMLRYRELDREGKDAHSFSPERISSITQDLKQGGVTAFTDPLYILYNHKQRWGWIGEGHHRLIAAQRAGLTHVPVRIMQGYKEETRERQLEGRGAPLHLDNRLVEKSSGYIPGMLHPGNFMEFEGAR